MTTHFTSGVTNEVTGGTGEKVKQFDHYKKWTTNAGYTFRAENLNDAKDYVSKMPDINVDIKTLREVVDESDSKS